MSLRKDIFRVVFFSCFLFFACFDHALADTEISHVTLYEDTTWTPAGNPYIVNNVTIPAGITLTLTPGVIVKVPQYGAPLIVSGGTLFLNGTEENPVVITSIHDDIGGDTNGSPMLPNTGNWCAIEAQGGTVTMTNTKIRYGGCDAERGMLYNIGATLSLSSSEISYARSGVVLKGGESEITESSFHHHASHGIYKKQGGTLRFGHNTFSDNASAVTLSDNAFQNDGGNTGERERISISSFSVSGEMTLSKDGLPYVLFALTLPSGATLRVLPGVVVKTNYHTFPLVSSGRVILGGQSNEPVIFTSLRDDSILGDTNRDGNATIPQKGDWIGLSFSQGTVTIANTEIRYGGYNNNAQIGNHGATITANNLLLKESSWQHLFQDSGSFIATESDFSLAYDGLVVQGGMAEVHQSRFSDISRFGILNLANGLTLDATNNWWGDMSGPKHPINNPNGLGVLVSDHVLFDPWSTCYGDTCHSSVLFLPGLEASRLYEGNEERWEPYGNADVERLHLNEDGESEHNIRVGDVIDNAYIPIKGNIYESFLEDMDEMKTERLIKDFKTVPYDWRLSFDMLLVDGSIEDTLKSLAGNSNTGKVTIIAHSNGGLLAKALIKKLGDSEASRLIDNLVLVAAPQVGTPQAIGALLHGYDQGLPVNWMPFAMSPLSARTLANNMPSAYPLLPSHAYFLGEGSSVRTPVIRFDDGMLTDEWIDMFGHKIDSEDELKDFLLSTYGKVPADSENTTKPSTINSDLLSYGMDTHQSLDTFAIPGSIRVYQIAGTGEETLSSIRYWTTEECILKTNNGRCAATVPKLEYTQISSKSTLFVTLSRTLLFLVIQRFILITSPTLNRISAPNVVSATSSIPHSLSPSKTRMVIP
ncbi:MAG: hypothetical protein HYV45_01720 [Candidatus Moranbacteria bacterium]|nr:hypothetical protein [Candidatus Moranbacteria bacterium]